jgi:hypothetical protein
MYFLVEFDHTTEHGQSINGGPWYWKNETHTTNRLVCADTFLDACILIEDCGEYDKVRNFKDMTLT